jgi:exopolysaccharide production protein ExoZ
MLRRDQPADNRRIESIQFLRCIAATLVVLYHTDLQLFRLSEGAYVQSAGFGAAGTDMLFVISGFVLVYISHEKSVSFGEFTLRRVARIVPLYWLLTLVMLAGFLASPGLFNTTVFDPKHFLASLALLPYPHPVRGIQQPFLVPGWALNYFIFFYVLFGLALFLPTPRRIAAVAIVLCALAALRLLFSKKSPWLDFYGAPIVLDFVLGMLVAWLYVGRGSAGASTIAIVLAASVAIFAAGVAHGVSGGFERVFYWALSGTGLLLAVLFIEKEWGWWNLGPFRQLGDASFSIYLSNLFTLAVVAKVIQKTGLFAVLGVGGTQALLVLSALAVGWLTCVLVERPLHAYVLSNGHRLLNRARRLVQSAPPALAVSGPRDHEG